MAEERLNIQYLVNLLAEKHGLDKKSTEIFIREFFLLIGESLEKDKYVKVKGLGTFKITEVKSRESINVNTGERFEIQGHSKVSFAPDASLRDIINKPFSHFETIILKDGVNFDNEVQIEPSFDDENDTDDNLDENIQEPTGRFTEEQTMEVVIPDQVKETTIAEKTTDEASDIQPEESVPETPEEKDEIAENITEIEDIALVENEENDSTDKKEEIENQPKLPLDEIIARELQESSRLFNKAIDGEISEVKNNRPSKTFIITTIIVAILVCGTAVLYTYFPTFIDDIFSNKKGTTEVARNNPQEPQSTPTDVPVLTDSIEQPETIVDTVIEEESIAKIEVKTKEPVAGITKQEKQEPASTKPAEKVVEKKKTPQTTFSKEKTSSDIDAQKSARIAYDETPVRPDSTSYNIVGTKTSYTIKSGETLTRVALRFYGTKDLWPYLVMHNRSKLPDPQVVPAGLTIQIPELEKK